MTRVPRKVMNLLADGVVQDLVLEAPCRALSEQKLRIGTQES